MKLGDLHHAAGAVRKNKRRGKGSATGLGGTSGRGHKGKKARSGGKVPAWFEGGQMPLQRRVPKRGFKNYTRVEYQVINVEQLAAAPAGAVVNREWLKAQRIVRRPGPIKLLGGGTAPASLTIQVDAASATARKAIEASGGKIETPAPRA